MTPGIAAVLDRLTDRKRAMLADLADAANELDTLLLVARRKQPKEMREDVRYASDELVGEIIERIDDLRRELETS